MQVGGDPQEHLAEVGEGREHDDGVGDEMDEVDMIEVEDMEEELGEGNPADDGHDALTTLDCIHAPMNGDQGTGAGRLNRFAGSV